MKAILAVLSCFVFTVGSATLTCAQGSADPGLGLLGDLQAGAVRPDSLPSSLTFTGQVSVGEENTLHVSPFAEGSLQIGTMGTSVLLRVPLIIVTGNLATTADVGDVMAGLSQRLYENQNVRLTLTAAVKLAQNRADKRKEFLALPMAYQTSLGTNDLIGGLSFFYQRWHLAAAYQQPLNNNNENTFVREAWTGQPDAQSYFESAHLSRAADVMLRVERTFALGRHEAFAGVQPIYHLQEDYLTRTEVQEPIKDSAGLTLNLAAGYRHHLTGQSALRLTLAAPVISREVQPDGLTRVAVGQLAYERRF